MDLIRFVKLWRLYTLAKKVDAKKHGIEYKDSDRSFNDFMDYLVETWEV